MLWRLCAIRRMFRTSRHLDSSHESHLSRYRAYHGRLNGLQNNFYCLGRALTCFLGLCRAAHRHVLHQDDTGLKCEYLCCVCESDILLLRDPSRYRLTGDRKSDPGRGVVGAILFLRAFSSADELLQNLRLSSLDFKWAGEI